MPRASTPCPSGEDVAIPALVADQSMVNFENKYNRSESCHHCAYEAPVISGVLTRKPALRKTPGVAGVLSRKPALRKTPMKVTSSMSPPTSPKQGRNSVCQSEAHTRIRRKKKVGNWLGTHGCRQGSPHCPDLAPKGHRRQAAASSRVKPAITWKPAMTWEQRLGASKTNL